jgi:tripartite-type tricarboxylate transporter receptor subunit TctC
MKIKTVRTAAITAAALSTAFALAPTANAETPAEFYARQNLTLVVGFSPGGGADTFARFFARHLGKHIEGKPSVVVQNMPGAGGIKALNHLYNVGAQNGSRIMMTSPSHTLGQFLGKKNIRYDIKKLKWIGTLTQDVPSCAANAQSGFTSIEQAKDKQLIIGGTGPSSSTTQHALLLANMFGYKIKVVTGYRGTAKVWLAMKKNEVQAVCTFWASSAMGNQAQGVASGAMVPIVQMGRKPHPAFGKAPVAYDLARNDEEREIMGAIFSVSELSRPYAAPPGTPENNLAALRKGFWAAVHTPALRADAKRLHLTVDPLTAEETIKAFAKIFATPKHLVDKAKKLIAKPKKKKMK